MTRAPRSPLDGTDRLLVDGNNLLHAARPGGDPMPAAALIGRLRGAIPAEVGIEIVFDGPADPGMRKERIASGLIVRHGGGWTADQVLVSLVDQARATSGVQGGADNILVVTDDRELRVALHARGAKTARSSWLLARFERQRLDSPSVGNRRAPRPPAATSTSGGGDDGRTGWQPGRGATKKRGNPKRGHGPAAGHPAPGGGNSPSNRAGSAAPPRPRPPKPPTNTER